MIEVNANLNVSSVQAKVGKYGGLYRKELFHIGSPSDFT